VARYRVLEWKGIPTLVEARDESGGLAQRPLSARFQELVDAVAMREGAAESDAYLDGWAHGPERERAGGAEQVAEAVAAELEAGFQTLADARLLGRRT
jgi:hypothetical protein